MTPNTRYPVRKPLRYRHFDYASAGVYFITICTRHMDERFGHLNDGVLVLNNAGTMIDACWQENAQRYPGMELDLYVIMLNHLHAILLLGTDPGLKENGASLSRIVQTFKSQSTVEYTRGVGSGRYPPFDRSLWQRGFHDRIIRNQHEFDAARAYIEANPARYAEQRSNHT